jgi:prevent-host-death family protein
VQEIGKRFAGQRITSKRLVLVSKRTIFGLMLNTVSITEAKRHLGDIADRALQGEQVVIVRKSKLLALVQIEMPEPVPMRPRGYFQDCYDSASVREENKLAVRSVRRVVK